MTMKKIRIIIICVLALWASALSAKSRWSFDYHKFQYDMTIYFALQDGDAAVSDMSDYDVAAFVGNECRGVATIETQTGSNGIACTYGFLKVYSNKTKGESVTFKCYKKSTGKMLADDETKISFASNTFVGYPSEPTVFKMTPVAYVLGDINSDGEIDVTDVVELIDMVLGGIYDPAGDINGDNEVDVTDVVELIDMVLSGE